MLLSYLKNWGREKEGTTAIEFSLLAIPFTLTVLCLIEISLFLTSSMMLESAVSDGARMIKTGQIQQSSGNKLQEFLDAICSASGPFVDCNEIQYQVEQLDDFNADSQLALSVEGELEDSNSFDIGEVTAGCVALVRVILPYQFLTPVFANLFGQYGGTTRLMVSTAIFQVEPYDFNVTDPNCNV